MEQKEFLYEGKAKQVYATDQEDLIIIHYKDDATAFNGIKKAQISNKGILNNKITELLFKHLEEKGIPTHFIERLNDRDQLCKSFHSLLTDVFYDIITTKTTPKIHKLCIFTHIV